MLATTSIGAVWSSCGSELGPMAVIDRLSQIEPKVLCAVDGYPYKGKMFDFLPNVEKVVKELPSLRKTVVVPYAQGRPDISHISNSVFYDDFTSKERQPTSCFLQVQPASRNAWSKALACSSIT
jgi:acetoacetyl-CoA synthetase